MYYCVVKGKTAFIALAKKEPFTSDNPDPILEPGEIWFDFGDTPEHALENLKESMRKENKMNPIIKFLDKYPKQTLMVSIAVNLACVVWMLSRGSLVWIVNLVSALYSLYILVGYWKE